jgi:hypothetical protein
VIRDKGYPLLPWLMVPHKQIGVRHLVLKTYYIKQLSHVRVVVENTFIIFKKRFWELMIKSNLHVNFLLDVVICCCILHNMILSGKDANIDALMEQLEAENVGEMKHGVTR